MELVFGSVFLGVALIALTRVAQYRRDLRHVARPMIELARSPFPMWTPDEPLPLAVQRMAAQFERVVFGRWQREAHTSGRPGLLAKHDLACLVAVAASATALRLLIAAWQ